MSHALTIGTDAEVLLKGSAGLVSAIGLIGGGKHNPFLVNKGNLQEDNVLAEFAIDPVSTEDDFVSSIQLVMESLKAKVGPLQLGIDIKSSAIFPDDQLQHPMAKEFGCDPDYNAWTMRANAKPNPRSVGNLRTCGGHIHVGFPVDDQDFMARPELVQWMDVYLGLPSVLLDDDTKRRSVYGKAGAHRPKQYGIEYRVLSNFWIKDEQLMRWAYRNTHKAYETYLLRGVKEFGGEVSKSIVNAINKSDKDAAVGLMKVFNVGMP